MEVHEQQGEGQSCLGGVPNCKGRGDCANGGRGGVTVTNGGRGWVTVPMVEGEG